MKDTRISHLAAALAVAVAFHSACVARIDGDASDEADEADEPGLADDAEGQSTEGPRSAGCRNCGQALAGLDHELRARFEAGRDEFEEEETLDEGIGPVFNAVSCAKCHDAPAIGGSSNARVTRFGTANGGASFNQLANLGGSLRQDHGIGELGRCGLGAEVTPADATVEAKRRTTPLFGLGLVDAVPDAVLLSLAWLQPEAIRGTPHWVDDVATGERRVGRFGWKAQVATLRTFAGDAYLNELGITTPDFPDENCPQGDCSLLAKCDLVADPEDDGDGVDAFTNFMTLLAPPEPLPLSPEAGHGQFLFEAIGCAGCHVPTLVTGPNDVRAFDHVVLHPYSDFLLHDMGALGDGITQGDATGRMMRTAPLWGVSAQPSFLHDGRASTLGEAIRAHDGQAAYSRDAYVSLRRESRRAILAFLKSL